MDDSVRAQSPEPAAAPWPEVCFGENCLGARFIQSWKFESEMQGNAVVTSAAVEAVPPSDFRWDYHAPTSVKGPQGLQHSGFCASSSQDGATITFRFKDVFQGLSAATIRNLEFFGMTDKKLIYWFTTLATEGRIVEVEGLTIDTTPRPFLYAIPLRGLSLEDGPSTNRYGRLRSWFRRRRHRLPIHPRGIAARQGSTRLGRRCPKGLGHRRRPRPIGG